MRRKVTLKVFTPLLNEFESQLEALHMKRDSFLDYLITRELPNLESDLNDKRLSVSARRFIALSLKRFGTSQINVQLSASTAERLDQVMHSLNLVRDSFINRLLYFSLGSDSLLEYFDVKIETCRVQNHVHPAGYLQAILDIQADPLSNLRRLVKTKHGVGLYLAPLPIELAGFECYLDDEIFWNKYSITNSNPNSTPDSLQTFETRFFRTSA